MKTQYKVDRRLRMTRQRRVILEELRAVDSHPSADEVYEMVRRRLPSISLGTVYRNLELLSSQGLIQKVDVSGTQRRFDGNPGVHYHVRCSCCGRVEDVPIEPVLELNEALRDMSNYEIIGHRMEFIGLCPTCRKRKKTLTKKL